MNSGIFKEKVSRKIKWFINLFQVWRCRKWASHSTVPAPYVYNGRQGKWVTSSSLEQQNVTTSIILLKLNLCVCVFVCVCVCVCARTRAVTHSVMSDSRTPGTSLLGSSVHGTLQARKLEWIAMSSSRGSPQPSIDPRFLASHALAGRFFITAPWEAVNLRCWD